MACGATAGEPAFSPFDLPAERARREPADTAQCGRAQALGRDPPGSGGRLSPARDQSARARLHPFGHGRGDARDGEHECQYVEHAGRHCSRRAETHLRGGRDGQQRRWAGGRALASAGRGRCRDRRSVGPGCRLGRGLHIRQRHRRGPSGLRRHDGRHGRHRERRRLGEPTGGRCRPVADRSLPHHRRR